MLHTYLRSQYTIGRVHIIAFNFLGLNMRLTTLAGIKETYFLLVPHRLKKENSNYDNSGQQIDRHVGKPSPSMDFEALHVL